MRSTLRSSCPLLYIYRTIPVLALLVGLPDRVMATNAARPVWAAHGARLSSAGERMLRDEIAAGRVLPEAVLRRLALDRPAEVFDPTVTATQDMLGERAGAERTTTVALAPDRQVNDKSGDATCAGGCGNRPLSQSETTIASSGSLMVAGSNNSKGFCTLLAVQGYGTSADGGVTWTWHPEVPPLATGGRYRGDPVHAVNRKTKDFYILGLYEGGTPGSGIALLRGHFSAGSFVIDDNRQIAVGGANFYDKNWLAVDSLSGNLYVTYSNFVGGATSQIEFIRSTNNGVTWSAPQVLDPPSEHDNVQGSRPVVGPNGEVYVVWYEFGFPLSHLHVRRSNDFGVSFGAEVNIADFYENDYSGAPGFRRGFGINLPGVAVDNSIGPHRGRLYVTWTEAVDFFDAPAPSLGNISEVETNDFFASATPFTVGQTLRGAVSSTTDVDFFKFTGLRGQTLFFRCDSATTGAGQAANLRLSCASDTSNINNYRLLAFDQANFPAVAFTLPADGTYYLRINYQNAVMNYRLLTSWDTPTAGERARDHRDAFVAWSDGGGIWSTPTRMNDDSPWFDGVYPEITVDDLGRAHCHWIDFRDDTTCGALSYEYLASSGDGGVTWGANRRVSDVQSFWSFNACGSANQGDYQGVSSEGTNVYPCWADSRLGDPDVFMECASFGTAIFCPTPGPVDGDSVVTVDFTLTNSGSVDGSFAWQVDDANGWLTGATPAVSGTVALAAGAHQIVTATLHPPGSCAPAITDVVRFITRDLNIPGRADTCLATLTCSPTVGVTPTRSALSFAAPRPNPSQGRVQFAFTLATPGTARLAIFGAAGTRVRTLADGLLDPGPHERVWDGRDERGRRVPAGVYYARLEANGMSLKRVVTLLR